MNRVLILCCIIAVLLSGCAMPQSNPNSTTQPSSNSLLTNNIPEVDIVHMEGYMEDLVDRVYDHEVNVYEIEGGFAIHISMTGSMSETTFADFIIDGAQTIKSHLPEFNAPLHEFTVSFTIADPSDPSKNGSKIWVSEDLVTGVLNDTANGRSLFNPAATLQDIADIYGTTVPIGE